MSKKTSQIFGLKNLHFLSLSPLAQHFLKGWRATWSNWDAQSCGNFARKSAPTFLWPHHIFVEMHAGPAIAWEEAAFPTKCQAGRQPGRQVTGPAENWHDLFFFPWQPVQKSFLRHKAKFSCSKGRVFMLYNVEFFALYLAFSTYFSVTFLAL